MDNTTEIIVQTFLKRFSRTYFNKREPLSRVDHFDLIFLDYINDELRGHINNYLLHSLNESTRKYPVHGFEVLLNA